MSLYDAENVAAASQTGITCRPFVLNDAITSSATKLKTRFLSLFAAVCGSNMILPLPTRFGSSWDSPWNPFWSAGGKRITPKLPGPPGIRPATVDVARVPNFSLFHLLFPPRSYSKPLILLRASAYWAFPSRLYRFGLYLFHDLPPYSVAWSQSRSKSFNYIE